jgi:hypothetical protein
LRKRGRWVHAAGRCSKFYCKSGKKEEIGKGKKGNFGRLQDRLVIQTASHEIQNKCLFKNTFSSRLWNLEGVFWLPGFEAETSVLAHEGSRQI